MSSVALASLKGSPAIQVKQNQEAAKMGYSKIKDQAMLEKFQDLDLLVHLANRKGLVVNPRLDEDNRYVRPATKRYLLILGRDFHKKFRAHLKVNSAVRTVEDQKRLARRNGNAGPTSGPKASAHLTGAAVDIAKRGLTKAQLAWLRGRLEKDKKAGWIVAIEENRQPVFHLMVIEKTDKTKPKSKGRRLTKSKRPG